jgi:sigma-54 dependent transcriptional regulator, acetoin dehydrogenase operon transcriptional activator AcoR
MTQLSAAVDTRNLRSQQAREIFFKRGEAPHGLLERALQRSWERCKLAGLEADARSEYHEVVEGAQLAVAHEQYGSLIAHASSIMEHVHEQIRHSGSIVILANEDGLLLHSVGDADFVDRAGQVALQPGARWRETQRGTNAIGTALAERCAVEVVGAEHFLERNNFLTCSAAPLLDPLGNLIGVLDISGDARGYQRHTLGLVRMSANLVEKRLFESEFARELLVCFHHRPEYIGSLGEGIAAVAQDGRILSINPAGLDILGLRRDEATRCNCTALFEASLGTLIDRARNDAQAISVLPLRNGAQLYVRLHGNLPQQSIAPRAVSPSPARNARPVPADAPTLTLDSLATGDARLQLAIDRARRVLGRDIPILIQGESGAGKEMFAKAIHNSGPNSSAPFVALNCAAIPENLIESELFGYTGGAFTGARKEGAVGKIQQAHGGTLFLDEIGDMPLGLQARLLRVLQERCVTPLGGSRTVSVDISLVCATHRRLKEEVASRRFREDLYYRINGLSVSLPSLRERTDLRQLVDILVRAEAGSRPVRVSEIAQQAFERYDWPGNIRQLNNVIRVAIALLDDDEDTIGEAQLPEELLEEAPVIGISHAHAVPAITTAAMSRASDDTTSLEEIKRHAVMRTLEAQGGNISAAARMLGVSRNTLYRKLGRL